MRQEMPLFTKTFDFLTWLLPMTNHFPKAHRHTYTQRLLNAAFDLREHIEAANYGMGAKRLALLKLADQDLDRVRLYVRLAVKWSWFTPNQYQQAAAMTTEIGKLLGSWIKLTQNQGPPSKAPLSARDASK